MKFELEIFNKEHLQLEKIKRKCYEIHKDYGEIKVAACCKTCSINQSDMDLPLEERCKHCKREVNCKKVVKCHKKLVLSELKQQGIRNTYAKKVFDYYSRTNPLLIRCQSGESVCWIDAFGDSFETTSVGQRNSLVALIEEDGGQYRLKS